MAHYLLWIDTNGLFQVLSWLRCAKLRQVQEKVEQRLVQWPQSSYSSHAVFNPLFSFVSSILIIILKWEPGTGLDATKWCINLYVQSFPDEAIEEGEQDVKRVLEKQRMMEEAQTLQKFLDKKEELDQDITREIEELIMMSENCDFDMITIGTV